MASRLRRFLSEGDIVVKGDATTPERRGYRCKGSGREHNCFIQRLIGNYLLHKEALDMKQLFGTILLLLLLFGSGCSSQSSNHQDPDSMPEDFAFSVSYGIGSKNRIDTYSHKVVKDLIADGKAEATITFSKAEMQTIYRRMMDIDVFGEKKLIADTGCFRQPSSDDYWKIRIGGVEKTMHITTQYCELTDDAQAFMDLRNFVVEMVEGKEEYTALPEPNGAYL